MNFKKRINSQIGQLVWYFSVLSWGIKTSFQVLLTNLLGTATHSKVVGKQDFRFCNQWRQGGTLYFNPPSGLYNPTLRALPRDLRPLVHWFTPTVILWLLC